jgi:hypothetical protein
MQMIVVYVFVNEYVQVIKKILNALSFHLMVILIIQIKGHVPNDTVIFNRYFPYFPHVPRKTSVASVKNFLKPISEM